MYGYGYKINSGLVVGAGGGGGGFPNTYSLDFDGVDDRLQLDSNYLASGEFTVSFWIKPVGVGVNGKQYVMGTFPDNSNFIKLAQLGVITIKVQTATSNFNETSAGGGSNNLVLDTWQHIMIVRDSSNVMSCYRNGSSFGGTATNSNALTLNSFGRIITNTFGYEGGLDEIALFQTDETANLSTLSTSPTVDLTDLSPTIWLRNGDNGAYKSPQWLIPNNENKGKVSNYSFEFDGVDDEVVTSSIYSDLDGQSKMTLSVWLKPTSGAPLLEYVVSNPRNSTANQHQFALALYEGNRIQFDVQAFNSQYLTGDINAITYGEWNHILVCVDLGRTTGTEGAIFINGLDETTASVMGTLASFYTATDALHIGVDANGGYNPYNGAMDELAIWSGQDYRGASEVSAIYNNGAPTDLSNTSGIAQPNLWYRMGEDATFSTNWTVPDQVGSNDGVSANMTIEDRVGEAPNSTSNSVSYNMDEVDRVEDTP